MIFRHIPGRAILNIKNEIDRVYDDLFFRQGNNPESVGNVLPLVDIEEADSAFIISVELPGVNKKDVNISFQDGLLTLNGKKEKAQKGTAATFHRSEREYGTFSRSFNIPGKIKVDKIDAGYENGLLTIVLPKEADEKNSKININVK